MRDRGVRPIALLDPEPRTMELMFRPATYRVLDSLVRLVDVDDATIDEYLPEASFLIGQTDMPRERLERAPNLKAIINVESNFQPNVDYDACFERGVHVLSVSPVFAQSVAELGLCLALDCARGVSRADRLFRQGCEMYGLDGNKGTFLFRDASFGIIGYGDLGVALHRLIEPFGGEVLVYDPWMPSALLQESGAQPVRLDELVQRCQVVFVVASVTAENEGFIGRRHFDSMPDNAVFVLLSRAAVVDFDAFTDVAREGRIRVATDVFPEEPLPANHPIRDAEHAVLSAHRAGATDSAFFRMGELVVDDIELMLSGLPPRRCKRAERETVSRLRSKPIAEN